MDAHEYRVGDAEREHVAALLQRAVGDGMITLDEFSDRMDTAMAARTRGELGAVLVDLPGMDLPTAEVGLDSGLVGPGEVLPLKVTMSSINRKGNWHVPGRITLKSRFSDVMLDLVQAQIATSVVTLEVDDICSSIDIVVPDDCTADLNGVRCMGGSASSRVGSAPPAGRVHLIVRGDVRFGTLTVKHAFGAWFRKNH